MGNVYSINSRKFLQENEVKHFKRVLRRNRESDLRNVILLQMALETGGRVTELLNLRKCDVNYTDQTVLLRGLKGSNDRELPLRRSLFFRLKRYLESQNGDMVFPIGYHRVRQIWDTYRPIDKPFHSLRHTFAIRLYVKTRDLRLLQIALGHRRIANTMVYADYLFSKKELRRIIF